MEFLFEAERFEAGVIPRDLVLGAFAIAEALLLPEEETDHE